MQQTGDGFVNFGSILAVILAHLAVSVPFVAVRGLYEANVGLGRGGRDSIIYPNLICLYYSVSGLGGLAQ